MQKSGPIIPIGKPNLPKMTILSFWSFVRAQRAEPDSLSFVINDNQTSNPSDIADGFNKLFSSYFTNSEQIREVTSPELDVPTISHLIITNDMVYMTKSSRFPLIKQLAQMTFLAVC